MPPTPTALRGTALVAAVIERVEKGRSSLPIHQLRPVPADALVALTLPNGAPLPPSLRLWLAYDASFVMRTARWFRQADAPSLPGLSFADLVAEELGARGPDLDELGATVLPAMCVRLTSGDSSFSFLYLGQPDVAGEYP